MNLDEIFSKEQVIKARYNSVDTYHTLRQPTPKEDLEFRRQIANIRVKNRQILTSDSALDAPLALYDKICTKVVVENGAGPQDVPNFLSMIPSELKLAVINAYQSRIEIEDSEQQKNS